MNESKPNYPFAFPWASNSDTGHIGQAGCNEGMTLRDYFAAKAMASMIAFEGASISPEDQQVDAKRAYSYADEMLKQREQ